MSSKDHVGIPKFLESPFSIDGYVWCYRLKQDAIFKSPIAKLGTEKDYYEDEVEKKILANGIEQNFSSFRNDFLRLKSTQGRGRLIDLNKPLLE